MPAVAEVSLECPARMHTIIVGPNGAGKSTLLRLLLGILEPEHGEALFRGRPSSSWPRRELARCVGVVTQEEPVHFPLAVWEYVEMGRHPYLRAWAGLAREDRQIVWEAIERTGLAELVWRDVSRLSAGEMQRARLARALAQSPRHLVLDEPTAHLDLGHEMEFFELVSDLVREKGLDVISITHNLNLAARYADHLVLLVGGRVEALGRPSDVLVPERLESAFGWPVRVLNLGALGRQVVPLSAASRGSGE